MGLDISAYRQLVMVENPELDADGSPIDWDGKFQAFTSDEFASQAEGIIDRAVYTYADSMGFRAGSYGGYNGWRNELAKLAGYVSADAVWAACPMEGPFVELINFSDCEGVIGPKVAAKLAKDFAEYQAKITGDDYFAERYALFKAAFEMASDNGAVAFR